jgi:hypothetical protein
MGLFGKKRAWWAGERGRHPSFAWRRAGMFHIVSKTTEQNTSIRRRRSEERVMQAGAGSGERMFTSDECGCRARLIDCLMA